MNKEDNEKFQSEENLTETTENIEQPTSETAESTMLNEEPKSPTEVLQGLLNESRNKYLYLFSLCIFSIMYSFLRDTLTTFYFK